ncbi:MAG: hypothetical protein FD165_449 [Gammaproteobacteria bacterium]|nr:MAG: hypothetical protein FD165_449 [Gammaproteobacteria bacterium]TND02288.1 MAG: hypothetical protein FD120_2452 [Gammaproteobacteria bacterium]
MKDTVSYKYWHHPLRRDLLTLRQVYDSMSRAGAGQNEIPLMIQLVENPRYKFPGFTLFHGAVDLEQHDYIHIILGRGMLELDEAFTIGFTMGSTKKVTETEEQLFALIAQYLYPTVYQFGEREIEVFRDAVRLGYVSDCQPLDEIDFRQYLDMPLRVVRERIGVEANLLRAYYEIEKNRYPDATASRRLLDA